jgi:chorismate synthase
MRVAVCTIARKLLEDCGIIIGSHVLSIGSVSVKNDKKFTALIASLSVAELATNADTSEVRMLDKSAEKKAIEEIKTSKKNGDTLGGVFEVRVVGLPVGLGSYVQADRRLSAQLSEALISIQAIKGVEIGDGFANAEKFGSVVHDGFALDGEKITRTTNRAGGLEGGMTNGQTLVLHAAMKPISTLAHPLKSVNLATGDLVESRYERSDVCAVPAASVVGEAVIAPVLANALLEKYGGDSLGEIQARYKRQ